MYKKILPIIVLITIVLTGCDKYDVVSQDNENYPIITPFLKGENKEVVFYYPNSDLEYLVTETVKIEIEYEKDTFEIVARELLDKLRIIGENELISNKADLIAIDVVGGTAYVNFTKELVNGNMSESEEALLLYSIVNTISRLESVEDVQILIEGKDKSTFCKYYSIRIPLKPSMLIVNREYMSPITTITQYYDCLKNEEYDKIMTFIENRNNNIDSNMLKKYLINSYGNIKYYQIQKYSIDKYDVNMNVEMDIRIYFKNEKIKGDVRENYNFIFSDDKIKLVRKIK